MRNEFERIQNRLPIEPLSMKRYELPPPPPGKISELSAWQDSVENSMAQLEHQAVRALNLELMLDYGCETWKVYLDILTTMLAKAQARLEDIKKEIQDVNWQRKSKQTQAGEKLRSLEEQWVMLVSKNYEIEQVCAKLEEQIAKFKEEENNEEDSSNSNGEPTLQENGVGSDESEQTSQSNDQNSNENDTNDTNDAENTEETNGDIEMEE